MRYPIDFLSTFDKTLLFWLERFIKLKLTTLSNRNVKDKQLFNEILQHLNKGVKTIDELKILAKEARQAGLIGINTYINPLEKLYEQLTALGFASMKEIDEETIIDFLATYTSGLSDATKKITEWLFYLFLNILINKMKMTMENLIFIEWN